MRHFSQHLAVNKAKKGVETMPFFNSYTIQTSGPERTFEENIEILKQQLDTADAVVLGAGSGLSTAAGYVYTGERMERYFSDFMEKYHFRDMYSGGFYPYKTMEEFWGFWCRYIWINRYAPILSDLYERIYRLVKDKDYFVLTTNVDHCFQRSGFDKKRLFYTQGDYGLFQSFSPKGASVGKTYDNYEIIRDMVLSEGYQIGEDNELMVPEGADVRMTIPSELVPVCPDDGQLMMTNLRSDDSFVEDAGWQQAAARYHEFLEKHKKKHVLYFELGVGMNTPVIIKFPFWKYTEENRKAFYACVNAGQAGCSQKIVKRSVCINAGIGDVVSALESNSFVETKS